MLTTIRPARHIALELYEQRYKRKSSSFFETIFFLFIPDAYMKKKSEPL